MGHRTLPRQESSCSMYLALLGTTDAMNVMILDYMHAKGVFCFVATVGTRETQVKIYI